MALTPLDPYTNGRRSIFSNQLSLMAKIFRRLRCSLRAKSCQGCKWLDAVQNGTVEMGNTAAAMTCIRCGRGSIGRSDARVCSNACRQWLYRNRNRYASAVTNADAGLEVAQ